MDDCQEKHVLIGRELCTLTVWGSKQVGDKWAQAYCKYSFFLVRLIFIPAVLFCFIYLCKSFHRVTQKAIWGNGASHCYMFRLFLCWQILCHTMILIYLFIIFCLSRYIFSCRPTIIWVCVENVFCLILCCFPAPSSLFFPSLTLSPPLQSSHLPKVLPICFALFVLWHCKFFQWLIYVSLTFGFRFFLTEGFPSGRKWLKTPIKWIWLLSVKMKVVFSF